MAVSRIDELSHEVDRLREVNLTLAGQLIAMTENLGAYQVALEAQNDRRYALVTRDLDTWRVLTRYNRATHFQVLTFLTVFFLAINDLARAYAHDAAWGLLLPLTMHGAGGPWEWTARALGLLWQSAFCVFMYRRAQVPEDLLGYVASGALTLEQYRTKWGATKEAGSDRQG